MVMNDAFSLPAYRFKARCLALLDRVARTGEPAVAVRAAGLGPAMGGDPVDRMVAATALLEDAPVVTRNRSLRDFAAIRAIW
jgi:predicted nucleic acid-binding protein